MLSNCGTCLNSFGYWMHTSCEEKDIWQMEEKQKATVYSPAQFSMDDQVGSKTIY